MSCGEEHETHCNEVLAEVWLFLDHECDQQRRELLRKHLDECNPCLAAYGLEEKLKQLLARKCGGEHAPNELRARLREQIRAAVLAQVRSTLTVEQTQVTIERRRTY
ncbi:MAG: mycothiol system anti-sigma-R factor [Pseudonocardia sp.]|nr:mycothiol system anti-sigma-R factor [Pseudonocardia sp.]MBO0875931.1 mycothiol system anti-sigma-R factor [Pseudonocardia sp.]